MILQDLLNPFKDPREHEDRLRTPGNTHFSSTDLFYCLIGETERTFKVGNIV
jgi:hypothetical protein